MRGTPVLVAVLVLLSTGCSAVDADGYVWEEYERNREEILRLSAALAEARDDTTEVQTELASIRERLRAAWEREWELLCWDRPDITDPEAMFESMGLRLNRRLVDRVSLDAFVDAKEADETLSRSRAQKLRIVLTRSGDEIMNPASLGASQINQRIAKALQCFGLDSEVAEAIEVVGGAGRTSAKPFTGGTGLRYFKTCGDAVCEDNGYRGPFPDVPPCAEQQPGDACATEGRRCDLVNDCNMFLVCAPEDPATRCAR